MRVSATLAALLLWVAAPAWAEWRLDGDASDLSFVSVKAGDVGEVHRFHRMSGSVNSAGRVEIDIELASVDTLIPLRDERMRELLFEVVQFPTAELSADVPIDEFTGLAVAAVTEATVQGLLKIREQTLPVTLKITVARLSEQRYMVTSAEPVVVNAAAVGLVAGVEKLREVAGLPSISKAVPVSFVFLFDETLEAPSLQIDDARIREVIPGQDKTVAYFTATNVGTEPVTIVAAESNAARAIELHTNERKGDMVRMRRLDKVTIPPGGRVDFAPGGHHLMVFGVGELADEVPVALVDQQGGKLAVAFSRFGLSD